jgi:hypothetical protein
MKRQVSREWFADARVTTGAFAGKGVRTSRTAGSLETVALSDDPPGFEDWFRSVTVNPDVPEDPGEVSAGGREWLRRFFDAHGPVSREVVSRAVSVDQVVLAEEGVTAVLADLHRTTSLRPSAHVDVMDGVVRIWINDGYTTPSVMGIERTEVLAEVGSYFLEQLDYELGTWPMCDVHDNGLIPRVREGAAVWWCPVGEHTVAPIGSLRP